MKILGIDYGRVKVGLALVDDENKLVYPLQVIRFKEDSELEREIKVLIKKEGVEKIVIGLPEGQMGLLIKKFGLNLKKDLGIPVIFWDETLSTREAQRLSIEAGIKRKKRKALEDAYAACLILREYLGLMG